MCIDRRTSYEIIFAPSFEFESLSSNLGSGDSRGENYDTCPPKISESLFQGVSHLLTSRRRPLRRRWAATFDS